MYCDLLYILAIVSNQPLLNTLAHIVHIKEQ